jgi:hypothetical protein
MCSVLKMQELTGLPCHPITMPRYRPAEVMIYQGKAHLIRERESMGRYPEKSGGSGEVKFTAVQSNATCFICFRISD